MSYDFHPIRYDKITKKNPREIVMLRGNGCKWRRCRFCDYHLDYSKDEEANFALNEKVLWQVTGLYHKLEVINSGSFCDLDEKTMQRIIAVCTQKEIAEIHFECHWMHRHEIKALRQRFCKHNIAVKIKLGVETFDREYRETVLNKGIDCASPAQMAEYADEICLLFGLQGQTAESMKRDVETGLAYFERVCINIMTENTTKLKPCPFVISQFQKHLYPTYCDNERVDILMENTDFGVGKEQNT